MADTIRETIIAGICTQLAEIRTANSYNSECGQNVQRAAYYFDGANLPGISVFPMPESTTKEYSVNVNTMPMQLRAIFKQGTSNPSVIGEQVLGDLLLCLLGLDDEWAPKQRTYLGSEKDSIRYTGGGIEDYPDADEPATVVVANFEITYRTKGTTPYERP